MSAEDLGKRLLGEIEDEDEGLDEVSFRLFTGVDYILCFYYIAKLAFPVFDYTNERKMLCSAVAFGIIYAGY